MTAAKLREKLGGDWAERQGGFWRRGRPEEIRALAAVMLEGGARLATIVTIPDGERGLRLLWCWDLGGTLLCIEASLSPGARAPSIADIYPGADWAERETRDYYAIEFEGRASTAPLVLGRGDAPGILLGGDK